MAFVAIIGSDDFESCISVSSMSAFEIRQACKVYLQGEGVGYSWVIIKARFFASLPALVCKGSHALQFQKV